MNVYFVLSETLIDYGNSYGDPPDAPEYGCICEIVAAPTPLTARYRAWKNSKDFVKCDTLVEMPRFAVRKLGTLDRTAGILRPSESRDWWAFVPEGIVAPGAAHEAPEAIPEIRT